MNSKNFLSRPYCNHDFNTPACSVPHLIVVYIHRRVEVLLSDKMLGITYSLTLVFIRRDFFHSETESICYLSDINDADRYTNPSILTGKIFGESVSLGASMKSKVAEKSFLLAFQFGGRDNIGKQDTSCIF